MSEQESGGQCLKCSPGNIITVISAVVITAIVSGGIVYVLLSGKNSKQTDTCEVEQSPTATATAVSSITAQKSTTDSNLAEDSSSITNKDFENLVNSGYANIKSSFAESIYYVLEASECCGAISAEEAEKRLIRDTQGYAPFDFSEKEQLAKEIKTNLTDLKGYKIGIAPYGNNGQLVLGYHLNFAGKIDKIYIASSGQLDSLN